MAVRLPHNLLIYSTNWYIFGSTTVEHKFFPIFKCKATSYLFVFFKVFDDVKIMLICNLYNLSLGLIIFYF